MSNECKDWINDLKNAPEHSPEHNEYLCMEYPFLIPRNRWTDEIVEDFDFSYTKLDEVEEGWRTLCLNLCEEIKQELLKYEGALEKYRIIQIKEKFGCLRWYDNSAIPEIYKIISKYEEMSKRICGKCGKPATRILTGWNYPFCEDCVPEYEGQKFHTIDIEEFYKKFEEVTNVNQLYC